MFFLYIGNVIIPTDEIIFFRGMAKNHQPAKSAKSDSGSVSTARSIWGTKDVFRDLGYTSDKLINEII